MSLTPNAMSHKAILSKFNCIKRTKSIDFNIVKKGSITPYERRLQAEQQPTIVMPTIDVVYPILVKAKVKEYNPLASLYAKSIRPMNNVKEDKRFSMKAVNDEKKWIAKEKKKISTRRDNLAKELKKARELNIILRKKQEVANG